ncbi:hypothetical protein NL676_011961 [Syzygium grande]|nr:hypothetical protein NL676_011961 [Syzygium grande]
MLLVGLGFGFSKGKASEACGQIARKATPRTHGEGGPGTVRWVGAPAPPLHPREVDHRTVPVRCGEGGRRSPSSAASLVLRLENLGTPPSGFQRISTSLSGSGGPYPYVTADLSGRRPRLPRERDARPRRPPLLAAGRPELRLRRSSVELPPGLPSSPRPILEISGGSFGAPGSSAPAAGIGVSRSLRDACVGFRASFEAEGGVRWRPLDRLFLPRFVPRARARARRLALRRRSRVLRGVGDSAVVSPGAVAVMVL